MASYFTFGYISWLFFSWFYIYLAQVRGLSLKTSAVYSIFPFMAMTVGSLSGGAASDWLARAWSPRVGRCFLPASALVVTGLLLLVGSRAESAVAATAVLACGAGALYVSQSSFWSVTADFAGRICRSGFEHREYELPDWRGGHCFADAADCGSLWMGGVVPDGDAAGDAGGCGVAGGEP